MAFSFNKKSAKQKPLIRPCMEKVERATRITGSYVTISTAGEECKAFVPKPLPPIPPLQIDKELQDLHEQALLSIGRLDSISALLPDTSLFIYMYIRKEAVLSSQIEGTQSSLSDLLLFESDAIPGVPLDDVQEVSNYVAAMKHGLERIKGGFPLSLRLIREMHRKLLSKGKGQDKNPGEFRITQNWIGGTRPGNAQFVPTPPEQMIQKMGELENFIHEEKSGISVLIKAALIHVQFETIHPFLDGNGRLGRLLITLILCEAGILKEPLLYLSLYFKMNRERYYELLQDVRTSGDWESWVKFFLQGVIDTAGQAVQTAKSLVKQINTDQMRIQQISGSVTQIHLALQQHPVASIKELGKFTSLTQPTVTAALEKLQEIGVVTEVTGKKRNKVFIYDGYIRILNEGTGA